VRETAVRPDGPVLADFAAAMKAHSCVVILLALCGTAARADADAPDAALERRGEGILEDANLDHAWFMPTGLTQPRGAWKISDTELLFLGLSYGVTDDLGITVGGMVPVSETTPGWVTGKLRFIEADRLHVAAQAGAIIAHTAAGVDDFDEPIAESNHLMPTAGLAASVCLDDACRSLVGGYGGAAIGMGGDGEVLGILGASAILHVTGALKLMIEADRGGQLGWEGDDAGFFLWYGLRLASPSFSLDLGVLSGVAGAEVSDGEVGVATLPWLKVAYRSL
jgi:hypothetical protein